MKKSHIKHIFVLLIALMLCVGLYVYFNGQMYNYSVLSDDDYITLTDNWTIENNGSKTRLPMGFEYDEYSELTLSRTLEDAHGFENLPYMLMPSKYYDYYVYLDDELIYSMEEPGNGFSKSSGYQLRMIRLDNDISNQTLRIKIIPNLGNTIKYSVNAPKIGSRVDMVLSLVKNELPALVLDIIIIIFGIVLLGTYFLMRGNAHGDKMFFIGMLSIMCGIYIICQYRITHLLIRNSYMLYYIEFMSLSIIPLIVSIFVGMNMSGKIQKIYNFMTALFVINGIVQNITNFIFKIDFKSTLYITHILIIVMGAIIFTTVIAEREKKNVRFMLTSLILPITGAIIDLIMMYVSIHDDLVYYFSIGLYIFIAMQAYDICRHYIKYKNDVMRTETYERLAFTDGLTGLYNRLSFENDINEKTSSGSTACISVDINNLKETNDTCGHGSGDILIRAMAEILGDAVGEHGKIYRIGGDEFIVLVNDTNETEMASLIDKIQDCRARYNSQNDMPIEFAVGVSFANDDDISYEKVIARADRRMYAHKRRMKEAGDGEE